MRHFALVFLAFVIGGTNITHAQSPRDLRYLNVLKKDVPSFETAQNDTSKVLEVIDWLSNDLPVMNTTNHEKHPSAWERAGVSLTPDIYIVGEEWTGTSAPSRIKIRRSSNHGETWPSSLERKLTATRPLVLPWIRQVSDTYMGIIFVRQWASNDGDIIFARVNATNFSDTAVVVVDGSTLDHTRPVITSSYNESPSNPTIFIAYYELGAATKIIFRSSTNNGNSWSTPQVVATLPVVPDAPHCSIDFRQNNLFIAYTLKQGSTDDIAVVRSTNSGTSWSSPAVVANSATKHERYPSVSAATSSNVFIAYEYWFSDTDRDIYCVYATNGSNFGTPRIITQATDDERLPLIRSAPAGQKVYIGYTKLPASVMISEAVYTNPTNWSTPFNVKNSLNTASGDDIVALLPKYTPTGGIGVSAVWSELVGGDYDIYFDAEWLPIPSVGTDGICCDKFQLAQNYPNPFNPSTTIRFALPTTGPVSLVLLDHLGREVKTLVDEVQPAGFKSVEWNSTNNAGQPVASGVYFYRLQAGEFVQTKKLLLLR